MSTKSANPKHGATKLTTRFPRDLGAQFRSWIALHTERYRQRGIILDIESGVGAVLMSFLDKQDPARHKELDRWLPAYATAIESQPIPMSGADNGESDPVAGTATRLRRKKASRSDHAVG